MTKRRKVEKESTCDDCHVLQYATVINGQINVIYTEKEK